MNQAVFVLLLMLATIVAFASGKFNFAIVAMCLPVILQLTGVLTSAEAWAGFSNTGSILFIPLFMLGAVLKKCSFLHHLKKLVRRLGTTKGGTMKILAIFALCSIALANFMNATAAIALLAPMLVNIGNDNKDLSRRGMLKWCSDIGCVCRGILPLGMALGTYLTQNAKLEAAGSTYRFSMFDPLMAKLPFAVIWAVFMVLIGYRFYKNWTGDDPGAMVEVTLTEEDPNDRGTTLSPAMDRLAYLIFFGGMALMVAGTVLTDIPILVWAFIFALIAVFSGVVTPKECLNNMVWISLILSVCTLPLTTAVSKTGADQYIAAAVNFVLRGNTNVYVLSAVFFLFASVTSQFMNDIASSSTYMALGIAACVGLNLDPRPIMMAISLGAGASIWTPMANSGQALAFGTGGYTFFGFIKASIVPWLVFFALFMAYQPIYVNFILK